MDWIIAFSLAVLVSTFLPQADSTDTAASPVCQGKIRTLG